MLETLDDPEVRRMSFETPEHQTPNFDIESEITDEDWEEMVESARTSSGMSYIRNLADLKVISPTRFQVLKLNNRSIDRAFAKLKKEINVAEIFNIKRILADAVSYMSLGFEIDSARLDKLMTVSQGALNTRISEGDTELISDLMVDMKLLRFDYTLSPELSSEIFNNEIRFLNVLRSESKNNPLSWQFVMTRTINLKIVFPNNSFPFTPEELEMIKEQNRAEHERAVRSWAYARFTERTAEIKLGLADRIVLDHNGLHAMYDGVLPNQDSNSNPPEQRNF